MKGWKNRRAARLAKNAALEEERQKIREIRAAHARGLPEPEAPKPLEPIQTGETPELPDDIEIVPNVTFDPSQDLDLVHKGSGRWAVEQNGEVLIGPFTGKGAKAKADEAKKALLEAAASNEDADASEDGEQTDANASEDGDASKGDDAGTTETSGE
jgi:hypothetical protein